MTWRSEYEQLRRAREILNLREDAEREEVLAEIARIEAETRLINARTNLAIANSRPSIQQMLRESMETDADYAEERDYGWACERMEPA